MKSSNDGDARLKHDVLDRTVLAAYGLAPDTPEPEIVAHLFKLYAEMTAKEEEVMPMNGKRIRLEAEGKKAKADEKCSTCEEERKDCRCGVVKRRRTFALHC